MNGKVELEDHNRRLNIVKITTDRLITSMPDVLQTRNVSPEAIRIFLSKKCEGFRIRETDVILVAQEHTSDFNLDLSLKSLAGASGTKVILVEYFSPELEANVRNFPFIGQLLKIVYETKSAKGVKTSLSNKLAQIARETGKPIAVADIANRAEYTLNYALVPGGLLEVSSVFHALIPVAIIYASMYGINRLQEFITHGGHFNQEKIHQYEKILLDIEDARRVFVSMGIRQLVREYQPIGSEPCRILACYPKAHVMRIANYLYNQELFFRFMKTAKQLLYRLYPALDISVRQYRWKDTLARIAQDPTLAGWQLFSNRSL